MDAASPTFLQLNGHKVDPLRSAVTNSDGKSVPLRSQTAEVLKVLAARPGQLVTKDELMQAVWPNVAVTDDSLVQCITEIRKALGDEKHEIVRTVPKRGYVMEAAEVEARIANAGALPRHWMGLAVGLAGLAVLGATYFWSGGAADAEAPTIAVLPFENINGDERWDRFAAGVTEDIITDLARFRDIPVIARTSTEVYRGKPHDVRAIGNALNVKYVLEGSLQVDGRRMRVTTQLINAETGAHVWSERYDRAAAELLDVQDEITEKIAASLTGWQGQITETERALTRRKNRTDLDAYDYWLLGIEAKHRMTRESQIEVRAYFEKGLKLAPDFLPLVRDMAIPYVVEMEVGSRVDFDASIAAHRKYTEMALALDPNDANVNLQMANARFWQGDPEQGARYEERALQLAPNNTDISMQLAWNLAGWEPERSMALIERSLKLNPRYPSWWNVPIALTHFATRRFDDAYVAAQRFGKSPTQAALLAMSAAQSGRTGEAAAAVAELHRMQPDWTAESMYPYAHFADETLLLESAAKAGLPVCMTPAQVAAFSSPFRFKLCDKERAKAATVN